MASSFIAELKRRKVFRVGTMYVVGGWILLQLGDVVIEPLGLPVVFQTALIVGLAVGFPIVLVLAWVYELTKDTGPEATEDTQFSTHGLEASVGQRDESAAPPLESSSALFVGRDELLARLGGAIESTLAGSGRLILLEGEAGVGKTSMAEALARIARARGVEVHSAWSWQGGGAPAFWLWVQILRSFIKDWASDDLRICLGAGAVDIAQVVPELRDTLSDLTAPPHAEPDEARFRLLDAISSFFDQVSARTPLMLVLEDLQWADPVSLMMLRFLLQNLGRQRLLLVGTYRGDEVDPEHPLVEALQDISRHPTAELFTLDGLDVESLRIYAEALSGRETSLEMATTLHVATHGNPFFVKQVVGLLTNEPGDESDARQIGAMPHETRALAEWQLRRLSDPSQSLLAIACAIGREFGLTLLARASGLSADELLPALDDALEANLIESLSRTDRTYRFTHALVRESIHQTLSTTARAKIHRRIGEALEELHGRDHTEHLAALAYHFGEAAPLLDGSQAVDYAKLAGDEARASLSYEKAAELFESASKAFELLGSPDPVRQAELWISHAGALFSAGEAERAQSIFHKAAIITRGGDAPELLAVAAIGFGGIGIGVADEDTVALLQEALDALGDEDSLFRVWTLSTLVVHLANFPAAHDRVTELVRHNIEMARSIGEPISLGFALVGKFAFERVAARTSIQERLAAVTEAAELGEKADYPLLTVNARWQILGGLLEAGDTAAADAEYVRLAKVLEQLRSPRWGWLAPTYRATRQLLAGHYEDVEKTANEAYALRDFSRGSTDPAGHLSFIFALRREQGRLGDIVEALGSLVQQFSHIPATRCALAVALLESDRQAEARSHFEVLAENGFEPVVGKATWRPALAFLAEICAALGDEPRAELLYDLLKPYRGDSMLIGTIQVCLGPTSLYLGMLAGTMERWQEAITLLEEALARCDALDSPPWRARTQLASARVWLARNEAGDLDRARRLLAAARITAEELGMVRLEREIGQLEARFPST